MKLPWEGKKTHTAVVFATIAIVGAFVQGELTLAEAAARAFEVWSISGLRIGLKAATGR